MGPWDRVVEKSEGRNPNLKCGRPQANRRTRLVGVCIESADLKVRFLNAQHTTKEANSGI